MTEPLPHRAEHIGSLLRPRELKDAFRARAEGRLDEASFTEALETAIVRAIRLQEDVGLESITDGEFRRVAWSTGLLAALDGLGAAPSNFEFRDDAGDVVRWDTCVATAPVRRARSIIGEEYRFLREHTTHTPKVTMPAPSFLHFFRGPECADRGVYPDLEKFWEDVVAAYRGEIADLAAAGATYLQLDEVPIAMLCDESIREKVQVRGEDPDVLMDRYVAAANEALADRPPDMTVAMHLCRGNLRGHWMASGGYEPVAERLFGGLAIDAFCLEYDTTRAGDFRPLRFVPDEKRVVLGLVSSKTPVLESRDDLRRRIDEAATVVPLERLALSPQCGFASTAGGNPLTEDDERRKLSLVVEVAEEVWGS